jgi:anaerobic ribonucleoside-triphosphate reductase activating protein
MLPLTIARKKAICKVLGPGERSVVWFHGCARRCPNCIADTMNETEGYEQILPDELADWVRNNAGNNAGMEGITLSGGEPLQQPVDLLEEFLMLVKHHTNLSVLCYTGYRLEDINRAKNVLQYIDVLIDGEYRQEEDFGQRWRGSANQRFHFLTDRYRSQQEEWNNAFERQIEMELDINGKLLISGVPSKDIIEKFTAALQRQNVDIDFS